MYVPIYKLYTNYYKLSYKKKRDSLYNIMLFRNYLLFLTLTTKYLTIYSSLISNTNSWLTIIFYLKLRNKNYYNNIIIRKNRHHFSELDEIDKCRD